MTCTEPKSFLNKLRTKTQHRQRTEKCLASNRLHLIRTMEIEVVLKSIPHSVDEWALDLGCGDGYQSSLLERAYENVVASDLEMDENPEKFDVLCDAHWVPFASSSFDLVLLSNVLEHVADRQRVVEESMRVLREDGVLVVAVPSVLWKAIEIPTYYLDFVGIMMSGDDSIEKEPSSQKCDLESNQIEKTRRFPWSYAFPGTHGLYRGNFEEILSY